jgi:hypothetical protein
VHAWLHAYLFYMQELLCAAGVGCLQAGIASVLVFDGDVPGVSVVSHIYIYIQTNYI